MDKPASTSGAAATDGLAVGRIPAPDLSGRTVVVMFCPVAEDLGLYEKSIPWLSPDEQARAVRFKFDRHRCVYTVAHLLLRCCLRQVTGRADWRFRVDAFGKPALAEPVGDIPLQFNLTHTAGLAACALVHGHEVGIDAEALDSRGDHLDLARHVFASDEVQMLTALPANIREQAFLAIWTAKEAVIKATGQGLQISLDAFSVDPARQRVIFPGDCAEDAERWSLHCHRLPHHHLALATRATPGLARPEQVYWHEAAWPDLLAAMPPNSIRL
jgi:4'-phosphopantetheinyl transferase